jgi:hypothetical protein
MQYINEVWTAKAELEKDFDTDLDTGMKGRVRAVRDMAFLGDTDMLIVTLDLTEFVEYNKPYMQHNYYDRGGERCLNAYEAGCIRADNLVDVYMDAATFDEDIARVFIREPFITVEDFKK